MRHGKSARPKPEDIGGTEAHPDLTRAKMMLHNCISIAAATLFLPSLGSHSMPGWWGPGAFLPVAVFDQVQSGAVGTQHVLPEGFWQDRVAVWGWQVSQSRGSSSAVIGAVLRAGTGSRWLLRALHWEKGKGVGIAALHSLRKYRIVSNCESHNMYSKIPLLSRETGQGTGFHSEAFNFQCSVLCDCWCTQPTKHGSCNTVACPEVQIYLFFYKQW